MPTQSASTPRLRRIASGMSAATVVLAILLVAAAIYLAVDTAAFGEALREGGVAGSIASLTPALRTLALALGLPSLALILWTLWNAFWLFRAYRAGEVVSLEIGRRIRRIGGTLVAFPFVSTAASVLTSIVVSWNNPEGQRQLVLSIGSDAIVMVVTGAMLMMVGWSMVEASRIADENRQFV
jgi:hypothetical protein